MDTDRYAYAENNKNEIRLDDPNEAANYTCIPGNIDFYKFNYNKNFTLSRQIAFPDGRHVYDDEESKNVILHIPCIYYAVYFPEIDSILFTKLHENLNDTYLPHYSLSGKKIDEITGDDITDFILDSNYTRNTMHVKDAQNPWCIKVDFVASIDNIKINQTNNQYIGEYFKTNTQYDSNKPDEPTNQYVFFSSSKILYDNYHYRRIASNSDPYKYRYKMKNVIYDTHLVILKGKLPAKLNKKCVLISRHDLLYNYINDTNSLNHKEKKNKCTNKQYSYGHITTKDPRTKETTEYYLTHDTHYFVMALQSIIYK